MPIVTGRGAPFIRISGDERMVMLAREVADLLARDLVDAVSMTPAHRQKQTAKELRTQLTRSFVQLMVPELHAAVSRRVRAYNGRFSSIAEVVRGDSTE